MKKKFLRGIAAFLSVVMMLPTAAFATPVDGEDDPAEQTDVTPLSGENTDETQEPTEPTQITIVVDGEDKTLYHDGGSNTLQLKIKEDVAVTWSVHEGSEYVSVSSSGLVTAKAAGTATIRAIYYGDKVLYNDYKVTVVGRGLDNFWVEENNYIERHYYVGDSFKTKGITAYAKYSDSNKEVEVTSYTVDPAVLAADTKKVTISYTYNGKTLTDTVDVTVDAKEVDTVKKVEILTPGSMEVDKDHVINELKLLVTWNSGKTESVTATKSNANGVTIGGYTLGNKITAATSITATYGNVTSDPITITVKEAPKVTVTATVTKQPTKTTYVADEPFKPAGMEITFTYSDGSAPYVKVYSSTATSSTKLTAGTTQITLTNVADDKGNKVNVTVTGLTVTKGYTATEIDNDEDEYELYDKEDIKLEIGDKLNDDIKWDDIFKEVSVKIDGKWKTIEDDRDLEDYPGVELLLKVYNKSDDEIKASHLNSDGEVNIQLYIKNGSSTITSSSKTICVYIPVAEAECTVSIYSSKTSTSSTYLKSTKTFSDFEDALAALKDEDELEDVFDVTLGTNYAIRIKFGEDQVLGSSYEFEPDYENPITIDLNGHELKLPSDWIVYDDCEDLVVTITNNNDDEDGSLVYRDKSVTLTVAEGSELEFSEDNIPMDSDAECTVSIYKNSSYTTSSYLIKTKVYETLKEALQDLEDHDEAMETFDIDEDYEDTFAVRMKLGEDQDLGTYTFAPDYDTTITIDLNGYELELESDWIDYEDCEDLVVKIDNNNTSKKGTLKYGDMTSTTISLSSSDAVLTFEEDKIPGLYTVTIGSVTNGTVTASPNKTTVGKGSTVTFTITPNEGYVIDTVKSGTKTITTSTSGYTVSSKGVGTYKLENISADVKLDVTFKKGSSSTSSSTSSSSAANWTNPFTDVSKNAQYYDAVAFVCSEGLFNGMTATKFEPTTTMTRAMFVTVLGRLAGVDVMKYSGTSFTDVSKTDQQISWAAPYIEWAVQVGLTNGTGNGKFSPNDPITHQQMYLFMYRYAMSIENITTPLTGVSLSGISDAGQIADWAEDGVKFASKYGILITSGGKLTPTENALRCELAMLLHGFCTKVLDK